MSRETRRQPGRSVEQLEQIVADTAAERDALAFALDRVAVGVVVLRRSDVISVNRAAKSLITQAPDVVLTTTGDGLSGRRMSITSALVALARETEGVPATATVDAADAEKRFHVFVVPFGERAAEMSVIFLCDPSREIHASEEALRKLYAMTTAEARLACELANGNSVDEAAARLNIKPNTARSHLKKVFSKTHTKRQGDLVRILTSTFSTVEIE